jgi:DNA ligase-associated metallophosphoesterase
MNDFKIHGQSLTLTPEGCVFLKQSSTLVAADLHLGKSAAFRAGGLPVPEGDTAYDLARIAALVETHQAARLVIAGDLFHAPAGITPEISATLSRFLAEIHIPLHLVSGNHDAKLHSLPCGLAAVHALDLDGIRIIHDPADSAPGPRLHLAGHWHPLVKLRDGARTFLRLPCFLLRGHTLVMPSFGSFTGGAVIDRQPGDRTFAALRERVVEIPNELRS